MTVSAPGDALKRVQDALTRAGRQWKRVDSGGYMAQCPAHDDRTSSLSVGENNGKVLLKCHAQCDTGDILSELGLTFADLFDHPLPDKARRSTRNTLREFPYPNAAGELVGIAVRQREQADGKRPFLPLKPNPDGSWDLGASDDLKETPFRLPELVAAIARGDTIWIAEGERDVNTLIDRCGVAATSNQGGAGKWKPSHAYWLRGATVVICQDRDTVKGRAKTKAGERHSKVVLDSLVGIASSVRVVEPAAPHKDVTDVINSGGNLDDLVDVPIETFTKTDDVAPSVRPETNGHGPPPNSTDTEPPSASGDELHRGQLRFAQRFAGEYGGQLLHAHGIGWHYYRYRWVPCSDGSEVRAVTKLLADALRELPDLDKPAREALYRDVRKVESAAGVAGVLTLAGNLRPIAVAATRLDGSPFLLNTPTGTVNMETGAMHSHLPFDYLSKMTRGYFDQDARSSVFENFLAVIQPDEEMRAFLARSLGSALLGLVRDHVMFIWHGAGANGKSTLRDAVAHALGDYTVDVPPDLLLQSKYGNAAQAPERMRLKGVRLAFCSEISKGAQLDEATMKKLTGGEPVNAKLLYKNPVQFEPSHTLVMLTNHLPQVRGDDPATWRRLMAVPFDHVVPPEDRDLKLPEKLRLCPDAVLAWIWRGWLDYQEQGLAPPAAVIGATREYQKDSDILARFLADGESVTVRTGVGEASADLYEGFKTWARAQGERPDLTQTAFSSALVARGFTKRKTEGVMRWSGIALTAAQTDIPPEQERC